MPNLAADAVRDNVVTVATRRETAGRHPCAHRLPGR